MNTMNEELNLVDEMEREDSDKIDFISLEAAELENLDYDTVPAHHGIIIIRRTSVFCL